MREASFCDVSLEHIEYLLSFLSVEVSNRALIFYSLCFGAKMSCCSQIIHFVNLRSKGEDSSDI